MKRVMCALLICGVLFTSCGGTGDKTSSSQPESSQLGYEVNLDSGTFEITPEQFISDYNTAVSSFMETSEDAKAKYLQLIPDFVASGEEIDINDSLSIAFETNENGKIAEIDLRWYSVGISDQDALNVGFIVSMLPSFLCPESDFDLAKMVDAKRTDKKTDTTANLVYGMGYAYGAYSIYIKPLDFSK